MFEYLMPALVMHSPRAASSKTRASSWCSDRSVTAPRTACPGASPSRPTTCAIWISPTSTRTSACRAWASSEASARTWSWPPTRPRSPPWSTRSPRPGTSPRSSRWAPEGPTASTRPSTTRRRGCPTGATVAIVRAYMAHHQGMTLVALANVLHDGVMRTRFHAEPIVQATELLLQERAPRDVAVARPRLEEVDVARARARVRGARLPPVHDRRTSRFPARTSSPTGATR